jgi:hypothetical protein
MSDLRQLDTPELERTLQLLDSVLADPQPPAVACAVRLARSRYDAEHVRRRLHDAPQAAADASDRQAADRGEW